MSKQFYNDEINYAWSILCDRSSVDQRTNLLSLFNVIDEITVSDLAKNGKKIETKDLNEKEQIILSKDMDYVTAWKRNTLNPDGVIERQIKIEWISPNGKILTKTESALRVDNGKKNVRVIFTFNRMMITVAGTYLMRLSIKKPEQKDFLTLIDTPVDVKVI